MRRCLSLNIRLNGAEAETAAKTLEELCAMLGYERTARIATAVNGEFVPQTARARQLISSGDDIEIVAPRQGG